jgi:DNA-binding transcriptional LysR family regulator
VRPLEPAVPDATRDSRDSMRLAFLRYFTVLAQELHFGRAASRLAITQPTLSGAIKSLEEDLGVLLFVRDKTRVELTPAGAAFLVEARHVFDAVSRARNVAVAVDRGMAGRLDIALAGTLILRGIPRILDEFERRAPGIEVALHEIPSHDQVERLRRARLSAGFMYAAPSHAELDAMPMQPDSFVLCMPAEHPLAHLPVVDLQEVAHETFLMFNRDVNPMSHDAVVGLFHNAGLYPRFVHSIRNWLTMVAMVSEGRGLAVVSGSIARLRCSGVRMVRLAGEPADAPASLVWNASSISPALQKFLDCARDIISAS